MRLLLLLLMATTCAAVMIEESCVNVVNNEHNESLYAWTLVDSVSGARVMVVRFSNGLAAVPLPSVPRLKTPPVRPPDGLEHSTTWADASTLERLRSNGWTVVDCPNEVPVMVLQLYSITRPLALPGQAEALPRKP